jgi:hypothetical protein
MKLTEIFHRDDDETQLRKFSEKYAKSKSLDKIPDGKLKHWAELTEKTDGQYISIYMTPKLWGDSIASLKTAVAILQRSRLKLSTAAKARESTAISTLRQEMLRRQKSKTTLRGKQ